MGDYNLPPSVEQYIKTLEQRIATLENSNFAVPWTTITLQAAYTQVPTNPIRYALDGLGNVFISGTATYNASSPHGTIWSVTDPPLQAIINELIICAVNTGAANVPRAVGLGGGAANINDAGDAGSSQIWFAHVMRTRQQ